MTSFLGALRFRITFFLDSSDMVLTILVMAPGSNFSAGCVEKN